MDCDSSGKLNIRHSDDNRLWTMVAEDEHWQGHEQRSLVRNEGRDHSGCWIQMTTMEATW